MISKRKDHHLAIAGSQKADFRSKRTLLDEVQLVHQALPELSFDEIDTSVFFLGKKLSAPLIISGMTGGTPQSKKINQDLAQIAESMGIAFGLGSQRAMLIHPDLQETYFVREKAPSTLILANLGLMQAKDLSSQALRELITTVGADAICLHLNPAMELVQPEGDRDFRGGIHTIERLQGELGIPIVMKETGCGLSKQLGEQLVRLGIHTVDVSGAGGTSWVGVETVRSSERNELGELLWDWGIPTAVSVAWMRELGMNIIATGGLRTGMDVAAALALGAHLGGMAAPVLQVYQSSGYEGARAFLKQVIESLQAISLLTGIAAVKDLHNVPKVLGPTLSSWLQPVSNIDP